MLCVSFIWTIQFSVIYITPVHIRSEKESLTSWHESWSYTSSCLKFNVALGNFGKVFWTFWTNAPLFKGGQIMSVYISVHWNKKGTPLNKVVSCLFMKLHMINLFMAPVVFFRNCYWFHLNSFSTAVFGSYLRPDLVPANPSFYDASSMGTISNSSVFVNVDSQTEDRYGFDFSYLILLFVFITAVIESSNSVLI